MYFFLRNNILTCTKIYNSFTLINVEAWGIVLTMGFPFLLTKEKKKLPQVSACAASAKSVSFLGLCSHFSTKSCDSNRHSKPWFWWNWWCLQQQTRVLSGFSQSPQKLQWNVGPSPTPRHSLPVILTLSTLWSVYEIIISIWLMNLFLFFFFSSVKMVCIVITEVFFFFFFWRCEKRRAWGECLPELTLILALEVEAVWKRWDGVEWGEFQFSSVQWG